MPHPSARAAGARLAFPVVLALALAFLLAHFAAADAARPAKPPQSATWVRSTVPAIPAATPTPTANYTTYLSLLLTIPKPPPTDTCPSSIAGWRGEYWPNSTLSGTAILCRDDAQLDFDWGQGSPDPQLSDDNFSARWTRTVDFAAGRYRFRLAGDDGVRLWVDGKRVIDHWIIQSEREYTAIVDLTAGPHQLKVEYFEAEGLASVALSWDGPHPVCPGFLAEYFDNRTLSGTPVFEQCEDVPIVHDWGFDGPGHGIAADNFSVRWTAHLHLITGTYRFLGRTDDGMRAWLNGSALFDAWYQQSVSDYRASRSLGEGDYDIVVEYFEALESAVAQFSWERRDFTSGTVISQKQGIDNCGVASTGDMLAWWNRSPYWEANIYLGGINSACDDYNKRYLTPQWLETVHGQGWNFIPTWVGPQAPHECYDDWRDEPARHISYDPAVAWGEGRANADAAAEAARTLGLTSLGGPGTSTIIYYDMEAYHEVGLGPCRKAVNAFTQGWVERLHELGLRAGAYGSAGSNVADWARGPNAIDDLWAAWWKYTGYNPTVTIEELGSELNSLWPDHQLIWQYAGGHNETWGGVTINIDNNLADGHVAGANVRPISTSLAAAAAGSSQPLDAARLQAARLLPGGAGWALAGGRLWWTTNAGQGWRDVTPALPGAASIRAAHYLDAAHGWLLLSTPGAAGEPGLAVARTSDGGQIWATSPLDLAPLAGLGAGTGPGSLDFVDADAGWLALALPSGSSFSRGALFGTTDGGRSWTQLTLPIAAAVRFVDAQTGWTAGGAAGDEFYVTRDGGRTWQRQAIVPPQAPGARVFYDLPLFSGPRDGTLAVTISDPESDRAQVAFYATSDGGRTWRPAAHAGLEAGPAAPSVKVPTTPAGGGWWVADSRTGRLAPAGARLSAAQALPASPSLVGLSDLQWSGPSEGWALVSSGDCDGKPAAPGQPQRCARRSVLYRTADGGHSWEDVTP